MAYCTGRILVSATDTHSDRMATYGEPAPEAVQDLVKEATELGVQKVGPLGLHMGLVRISSHCAICWLFRSKHVPGCSANTMCSYACSSHRYSVPGYSWAAMYHGLAWQEIQYLFNERLLQQCMLTHHWSSASHASPLYMLMQQSIASACTGLCSQ